MFILTALLLGIGLAMDAFSVSVANTIAEPSMTRGRKLFMASVFAGFQCAMPLIGWICVHTLVETFTGLQSYIPWAALILLLFIGGKMIFEGVRNGDNTDDNDKKKKISTGMILVQGIATAIDALSVGFTIAEYDVAEALLCAAIIAIVTFIICIGGIWLGSKIGGRIVLGAAGKEKGVPRAPHVIGGIILIGIGLEIFIKGVFF